MQSYDVEGWYDSLSWKLHGSKKIELKMCSDGKDFGKGFYMTSNLNQARNFIPTSLLKAKSTERIQQDQNYGFVSVFSLRLRENINIYEFPESSKEWLWFISQNRRKKLAEALIPLINPQIFDADIISGKVANDTTNPVIATYLNGLYGDITSERAIKFAIEELMPDHLDDQYCFLSEKAIGCLEFKEAIKYAIR